MSEADEYVALMRNLGRHPICRADLSTRIIEAAKAPGFVCDPDRLRPMQAAIADEFEALRQAPTDASAPEETRT